MSIRYARRPDAVWNPTANLRVRRNPQLSVLEHAGIQPRLTTMDALTCYSPILKHNPCVYTQ